MSGLNEKEVEQQIAHMVKFIEQEAKEKAEEINVKAEEEFNIEKGRLVQQEKIKLMQMFERKEKQIETEKKIAYSNKLNAARLQLLKSQDDHLSTIADEARQKLKDVAANKNDYKKLLSGLLAQGLCVLIEAEVVARVRKNDVELIESVIAEALVEFKAKTGKESKVIVDKTDFLADSTGGGVLLTCFGGKIVVDNTLEKRLDTAIHQLLPAIRYELFGASQSRTFFD